jgi:hypothetical protein
MSITWRGLGFLGFMIPLAFAALAISFGGINNTGAMRIALLLSAGLVWYLGRRLNAEALEAGEEAPHQAFGLSLQNSALISVGFFVLTFF